MKAQPLPDDSLDAAFRKQIYDTLYEVVVRPVVLDMVKRMRERQPAYWNRKSWWIR